MAAVVPGFLGACLVMTLAGFVAGFRYASHVNLIPLLAAFAAALLTLPGPLERIGPRDLPRHLTAPTLVSLLAELLTTLPADPAWAGAENLHSDLLFGLARLSPFALLLVALLGALVTLPLLLMRRVSAELEWQALAGLLGGLAVVLALGGDVVIHGRPQVLLYTLPFAFLGAASYLSDRWAHRGEELQRGQWLPGNLGHPLRIAGTTLGLALLLPLVFQPLAGALLRLGGGREAPEIEEVLLDCEQQLQAFRAREGHYPSSLGELPGVDPALAGGVKHDYVFRYGTWDGVWTLAADPQREGSDWGHYRIGSDDLLELGNRPWRLRLAPP